MISSGFPPCFTAGFNPGYFPLRRRYVVKIEADMIFNFHVHNGKKKLPLALNAWDS
jgi:hypothetical protein